MLSKHHVWEKQVRGCEIAYTLKCYETEFSNITELMYVIETISEEEFFQRKLAGDITCKVEGEK